MIPSGIAFLDEAWKAAAEFEQAMIRLQVVFDTPPSREVVLEEYRRDVSSRSPADVAHQLLYRLPL